ncbi:MAG: hypothetical protein HOP10_07070 [Chitinophagaceae bacterium]|nr:hypothetical protein [Chitinophagaceae bacterium]
MQNTINIITSLLVIIFFLIMLMAVFIFFIIYLHRKKQLGYLQKLNEIEANYEKNLLKTQLEIQEQTFQHISREIHDNITLSLTLAKLQLHTLDWGDKGKSWEKINSSIGLLGGSISQLSDISKSLNADIIIQQGLLQALEEEIQRIRQAASLTIEFNITGVPVYLDAQKELIIFRIIQEAFNNIIKHARAKLATLSLHYNKTNLLISINDDGQGFDTELNDCKSHAGLKNMQTRISILKGTMNISSRPGGGTLLSFTIPFE